MLWKSWLIQMTSYVIVTRTFALLILKKVVGKPFVITSQTLLQVTAKRRQILKRTKKRYANGHDYGRDPSQAANIMGFGIKQCLLLHGAVLFHRWVYAQQGLSNFHPYTRRQTRSCSHAETFCTSVRSVYTCQNASTDNIHKQQLPPRKVTDSSVKDEYSVYNCSCYGSHGGSLTHDYFCTKKGQNAIIVKDRLKQRYDFWEWF